MPEPAGILLSVPLAEVFADDDFNCRGAITPMSVVDLAKDIQERGLIQPVTVAPYNRNGYKYRLIAGFRRYNAHKVIQRQHIDVIVRDDMMDDEQARFFNLCENLQRADLTIVQEAKALKHLQELGCGEHDTANRLNKSRGWVQVRYLLLKLPVAVQAEVEAGFINQTQIRELYTVFRHQSEEKLFAAVRKIKNAKMAGRIAKTVDPNKLRQTAKRVRKRPEIFEMMAHVAVFARNGLHTRCLSWAAGEISDGELYDSIEEYCGQYDNTYIRPREET